MEIHRLRVIRVYLDRPAAVGGIAQMAREFRVQGGKQPFGNMRFDIRHQIRNQPRRFILSKPFLLRVPFAAISQFCPVKGEVDILGEPTDRVIGLGQRGAAFEHQRRGFPGRQREDPPQGPANPEVLLDDRVGDATTSGGFAKECGTVRGRQAGNLIQERLPRRTLKVLGRQSRAGLPASTPVPGSHSWREASYR